MAQHLCCNFFKKCYEEDEIQVGLFRVPIPTFDKRAYREALLNALMHRDYTRLGAVHMRWESDGLVISNPGGFVEGVTLENLLVVEPKSRNPLLADAIKRIGLVERTGRGVDTIYQERAYTLSRKVYQQLGQKVDDIRQSEIDSVEQEQQIINYVIEHGKIKRKDVVELCHVGPYQASRLLNKLSERGLLRKIGERKNTSYVRNAIL